MPKVKLLDKTFVEEVPKIIKCRMIMSGLTQTQLAKKSGITPATMSLRMSDPGTMRLEEVIKIAATLKSDPIELLIRTGFK